MTDAVLGLDLSTRAAAAVAVPRLWDGKWSRVRSSVTGLELTQTATDAERALRTEFIAAKIVAFARANGVREVWIESYAYGMRTMAHTLGEVGGVVRLELVRAGFEIHTANMGTLRKLLLGKVPRKGAKDAVVTTLRAAGASFDTVDEFEAFACANFGLADAGCFFFGQEAA
jgi:hypothetical protein